MDTTKHWETSQVRAAGPALGTHVLFKLCSRVLKHALLPATSREGQLLQQGRDVHTSDLDALGAATANAGEKTPSTEEGGRKRSSRCDQAGLLRQAIAVVLSVAALLTGFEV